MRLRYLHLQNYPPLNNIEINFSAQSPLERECAIRFVIGVNGSGKTHFLQALAETFMALSRQQPPHFPITLIYELGQNNKRRTLIFHNPGGYADVGWWQSTTEGNRLPPDYTSFDWQNLIERVRDKKETGWSPLIRNSAWPGIGVGLPRTILAYTTGELEPWFSLFRHEPSAGDVDIVSQSEEYDESIERPCMWNRIQEIDYQRQQASQEALDVSKNLRELEEQAKRRERDQDICQLITPTLMKLALLSVSLSLAMEELQQFETEKEIESHYDKIKTHSETGTGLRDILTQVGWIWPVSVVFTLQFKPDDWTNAQVEILKDLYQCATSVVREPEPSMKRNLFFDLKSMDSKNDDVSGNLLKEFLGGRDGTPFDYFNKLLSLHRESLIENIQIALRTTATDDILLFDELSDGEQVFLGRMALFHLMQNQHDALILLDEPETHFNDKWKREIVNIIDEVLQNTANDVIISTHSSITLSDVFNDEIVLLQKKNGNVHRMNIASKTFGADPSEVMVRLFDVPDSIGQRSMEWLDQQLRRDWKPENMTELKHIIDNIGPGFHRSELRAILRELNHAS